MKFMLITMMLANPMTYADKSTCTEAANALKQMDMEAVCIPAGIEHQSTSDKMLQNFMAMVTYFVILRLISKAAAHPLAVTRIARW